MDPEGTSIEEPQAAPESDIAPGSPEGEQQEERPVESVGTMEGAFERAMARESGPEAQEGEKPSDAAPAGDAQGEPAVPPQPTTQQQLDRLYSMYRQGRTADLTSQERGLLNRILTDARTDVQREETEEKTFREMYLTYLSWQEEDPEQWVNLTTGKVLGKDGQPLDPTKVLQFMGAYKAAHPDVSLDNPDAPTNKRGDVRREAMTDAFERVDTALLAAASEHGISEGDLVAAADRANGDFTAYLGAVIKAAVAKGVEKELPAIKKAERAAYDTELSAIRAQTFRTTAAGGLPSSPVNGNRSGAKPGSWEAALESAMSRQAAAS